MVLSRVTHRAADRIEVKLRDDFASGHFFRQHPDNPSGVTFRRLGTGQSDQLCRLSIVTAAAVAARKSNGGEAHAS